ncbi:hypothetical protein GLYMA_16G166050v4 [Glycine max]|nr:hypothetical protein GLYMA_16G166050v4 [Glycine max]
MMPLSHPRTIILKTLLSNLLFPTLPLLQRKNEPPFILHLHSLLPLPLRSWIRSTLTTMAWPSSTIKVAGICCQWPAALKN